MREPKRGGIYRGSTTGAFAGADPHNSVYGGAGVVPQVYSYLFRKEVLRPDLGLRRELAVSHELLPDGTTWIFKLRPDARISPNAYGIEERAIDSDDVLATWDRLANPRAGANGHSFFARWVASYDAPDSETVRVVTNQPYAWVEEEFGDNLKGAIVPREWLEHERLRGDSVGSGAFMLKELTEGQRAVMVPNPNYYEQGLPYIDEYQILLFSDVATQRTAFTTRQIDTYGPPNIEEAKEIERQVAGINRYEYPTTGYQSFWMRTDVPPWDDGRVRRAMNLSMNRDQYIQIIGRGQGTPLGPLSDVFVDYVLSPEELARLQPYDPQEAKRLFDAAGISDVSFAHPAAADINDLVNIMVQQLRQIGITAKPEPLDAGTWVAQYFGSALSASFSLNQSYKTPDFALLWYRTGGITGNNRYDTKFSVPEVDQAIDEAAVTMDPEARQEAYRKAQRVILENAPAFVNVFHRFGNGVTYDDVQNHDHGPGGMSNALVRTYWIDA